jgi:PLP dependent protein
MYEKRLRENLPWVEERIADALRRAGRSDVVRLIAVTKSHPVEAVRAAWSAGLRDYGENRVQELDEKRAVFDAEARPQWHLIGHLQRNKARRAVQLCDLLHSLDSLRLAQEVSKEAVRAGTDAHVLIQVNMSGEETKGGFDRGSAAEGIAQVAALPGLVCDGLMTMAPLTEDDDVIRDTFRRTREALEHARAAGARVGGDLSMGMSGDFEIAIEEGSTMIRLGTLLFGERQ